MTSRGGCLSVIGLWKNTLYRSSLRYFGRSDWFGDIAPLKLRNSILVIDKLDFESSESLLNTGITCGRE